MMSIDQGKSVIIVLLDLSAVFDQFDHNVVFSKLKDMLGVPGKELKNDPRECYSWYFI